VKIDATTILAFYGSILATIVFLWDIIKYIRDKPRLRVKVNHRLLGGTEHKLGIEVANVGRRTITVVASGFKFAPALPDGNMATVYDRELPEELHEGQSHTSFASPSEIPQNQVMYGWARDATGSIWWSKKWPLRSKK
jgi:hypothetical protein